MHRIKFQYRTIIVYFAAAALVIALPRFASAASLQVITEACVTHDGESGTGCILDNITTPTSSETQTASGKNAANGIAFTNSATAFADAADYGALRMSATATLTGSAQAQGLAQILIADSWTLANPLYNGMVGTLTAGFTITGTTSTSNNAVSPIDGQARTLWQLQIYNPDTGSTHIAIFDSITQLDEQTFLTQETVNGAPANTYGTFAVTIPFIIGSPFDVIFDWSAFAQTVGVQAYSSASALVDLANTLTWGGFSEVRVGSTIITDFTFTADSGFDWSRSTALQVDVPGSLVLFTLGVVALGIMRYRVRGDVGRS